MKEKQERIEALDLLRGIAMILVVLYHILYDLRFIYGKNIPDLITPGNQGFEVFHTCFLWVLFAVSGICTGYSRNSVKRGAVLYIIGWMITAVTAVFMPSELIVFGVLSCFGACMVITGLIKPLFEKVNPWIMFSICFALWFVFRSFHRGQIDLIFTQISVSCPEGVEWLYPVGLPSPSFISADYFPIIPYIFMFWAGAALYRPVSGHLLPRKFYEIKSGPIGFIGRNSLIIYAVHQPLLLILFEVLLR